MKQLLILGLVVIGFAVVGQAAEPFQKEINKEINLIGSFPDTLDAASLDASAVNSSTGPVTGKCKFDHHSGFEGYAMNFMCVGPEGIERGRLSLDTTVPAKIKFIGGSSLEFFEGKKRWIRYEYGCEKLNAKTLVCRQASVEPQSPKNLNQFPFVVTEDRDHKFVLEALSSLSFKIPCDVSANEAGTNGIKVKCVSFDGAFVGTSVKNGANEWDLEGEFSTFYGPGNFLQMVTECKAATGSSPKFLTSCPALNLYEIKINTKLQIVTDKQDLTAYVFDDDTQTESKCNDACAKEWPPIEVFGGPYTPPLTRITRKDGAFQAVYKGRPLYRFAGDKKPGDQNGADYSKSWHVAKP